MGRFFQSTLLLASAAGVVGQFSCAQTTSSAREEDKRSEIATTQPLRLGIHLGLMANQILR